MKEAGGGWSAIKKRSQVGIMT